MYKPEAKEQGNDEAEIFSGVENDELLSSGVAKEVEYDDSEKEVEMGEEINRRIAVVYKPASEAKNSETEKPGGGETIQIASNVGKGEVSKDGAEKEVEMVEEIIKRIAVAYKPVSGEVKMVNLKKKNFQEQENMMGAKGKLK